MTGSVLDSGEVQQIDERLWVDLGNFIESYAWRRPVRKVAMVGNAPLEPSEGRAREIDSSDLVIRANSFVLDNPDDLPTLGKRADVVLLSRNARITPWVFHNYRSRAYLVPQGGFTTFWKLRGLADHWPADLGGWPVPNRAVMKRLNDLLKPDREPGTLIPTTGMTGAFLAHELFPDAEKIVTGISFLKDRAQKEWEHHFGSKDPVDERHRIDLEGALLESWVTDGSMRFLE